MKSYILINVFSLFFVFQSFAANEEGDQKEGKGLIEAVETVSGVDDQLKSVGIIENVCDNCRKEEADKTYKINEDEIILDTPYFKKDKAPYIIHLVRTDKTPNKVRLKFKNGEKVCGKIIAYTNPYSKALGVDCLFYVTQYREEIIDLNLKSLSKLNSGEEQRLEIKISKPNIDRTKYEIELNSLNGKTIVVEKDKKFFLDGVNFKLTELN
jgi:hypothetical protein